MIIWLIIHYTCWLWGVGTDFRDLSRALFTGFSVVETIVELGVIITAVIGYIGRDK